MYTTTEDLGRAARPGVRVLTASMLLVLNGWGGTSSGATPDFFPGEGAAHALAGDAGTIYAVGGTVTGLEGAGLILKNNDGDDLEIGGSGDFDSALVDVHGAGAQRSNGKLSIIDQAQGVVSLGYGTFYYHGPQGGILSLDNMVRCTRNML